MAANWRAVPQAKPEGCLCSAKAVQQGDRFQPTCAKLLEEVKVGFLYALVKNTHCNVVLTCKDNAFRRGKQQLFSNVRLGFCDSEKSGYLRTNS